MKAKVMLLIINVLISVSGISQNSFYDFVVEDIDGKDFSLASLKGKKVMVVNVASKCGLTPQYEKLEALYKKYESKSNVIDYHCINIS